MEDKVIVDYCPAWATDIEIAAYGPVGVAGNYNQYEIRQKSTDSVLTGITFQSGIPEEGQLNGCLMEHLLEVCKHRLQCFQSGPYACEHNQRAMLHITAAIRELDARTLDRFERDVKNKHVE